MHPTVPTAVTPPATVLLVGVDSVDGPACRQLRETPDERVEIRVSLESDRPQRPDELPCRRIGVVWVPPDGSRTVEEPDFTDEFAVTTVASADDLPGCGLAISRYCEEWADHDVQIVVCVESLEELLERSASDQVFRFLHLLTRRLEEVGALAHLHLDPTAADRQTAGALAELVDAVVVQDTVEPTDTDQDREFAEATDEDIARALNEFEWQTSPQG